MLFCSNANKELKQQYDDLQESLVNPYTNYKMWLRFEQLDIDAIWESIQKRTDLEKAKEEARTR
jgi:hypothetical protein